jgi:hypothetical protein
MRELHSDQGVKVISFVEKKFVFGSGIGEARNNFRNINEPWVGFVHCPVVIPTWFNYQYSPAQFFQLENFQQALQFCVGLYSLSTPLAEWLRKHYRGPVDVVLHPTELVDKTFDPSAWCGSRTRRVVQLGFWLRKLNAIWNLKLPSNYVKCVVGVNQPWQREMLYLERAVLGESYDDAEVNWYGLLSNEAYDQLLASAIVFVDFYDTSANNAIVECIARGVPVLCPPNRAIIDYLGVDYPLYFNSHQHAVALCQDDLAVRRAHEYLMGSGVRKAIGPQHFLNDLSVSKIFKTAAAHGK